MAERRDRALLVGCAGLALTLGGALAGESGGPLALIGLMGTLFTCCGSLTQRLLNR